MTMSIEVGKHYRLICKDKIGGWGGAEIVITKIYGPGTVTYAWLKEVAYDFEIVDRDTFPPYDSWVEDPSGEAAYKGLAFENEIEPLD